jgi:hypothetical protein
MTANICARHGQMVLLRRAARDARSEYICQLLSASCRGDDVEREAADWLRRLRELVGPHLDADSDLDRWYEREEQRLLHLAR